MQCSLMETPWTQTCCAIKMTLSNMTFERIPHSLNCNHFHAWEGRAAHGSALYARLHSFFPPPVCPPSIFPPYTHTAGIDPQPTPSLLHPPLRSMTHKAHLTFTQRSVATHRLQAANLTFFL